jgi:hypothetical protein
MGRKPALKRALDDLVLKVSRLELSECRDFAEFKECIRLMVNNLEETLSALACYEARDRRVRRAAEDVKLMAIRLLELGRAIPDSCDNSEKWREIAIHITSNYEQFRIQAGHFYQLAVPDSTFGILRSAL